MIIDINDAVRDGKLLISKNKYYFNRDQREEIKSIQDMWESCLNTDEFAKSMDGTHCGSIAMSMSEACKLYLVPGDYMVKFDNVDLFVSSFAFNGTVFIKKRGQARGTLYFAIFDYKGYDIDDDGNLIINNEYKYLLIPLENQYGMKKKEDEDYFEE